MTTSKLLAGMVFLGATGIISPAMAERGPGEGALPGFIFDRLDADKDGKVTKAEIEAARTARATAADANGDGLMSAQELAAMQLADMTDRVNARAAEMVRRLDSDGDGLLSAAEMAARRGPLQVFDRVDTDGDGAISRQEADAAAQGMADRRADRRPKRGDDQPAN